MARDPWVQRFDEQAAEGDRYAQQLELDGTERALEKAPAPTSDRERFESGKKPRSCVVCGTPTGDRHVILPSQYGRGYSTPRCHDGEACAARRRAR